MMNLAHYLGLLHRAEDELAHAYREIAGNHAAEPDVAQTCLRLASQCDQHVEKLAPFAHRYSEQAESEPERLHSQLFTGTRTGGLGLLRDLHDLYLMAAESDICWTLIGQAAQGARDPDLLDAVHACETETTAQMRWLRSRMQQAAPQALVVSS